MASQVLDSADSQSTEESADEDATKPKVPRVEKKSTRASTKVFLVGRPTERIMGSQLPTGRQAFQYFLHLKKNLKNQKNPILIRELSYEVIDEITIFWNMARIKTMKRQSAMLKLENLIETHRTLSKSKNRKEDPHGARKKFELTLDSLFDIGAQDAVQEIMNNRLLSTEAKKEDIAFYKDQQTQRLAHMSGHDKIFETKAANKLIRDNKQEKRRSQNDAIACVEPSTSHDNNDVAMIDTDEDSNGGDADDTTFSPSMRQGNNQPDKVQLQFSRDIMSDEGICSVGDRLGMSDNQVTAVVAAVLKAGGADIKEFIISRSSTGRRRTCARLNLNEVTVATFKDKCPDKGVIHWDGKSIKHPLGSEPDESIEHLAVLVTGVPDYEEGNCRPYFLYFQQSVICKWLIRNP